MGRPRFAAWALAALLATGCTLDRGGLRVPVGDAVVRDAAVRDAMTDAAASATRTALDAQVRTY